MGKYADVVKGLPPLPTEAGHQEKVEKAKAAVTVRDAPGLAQEYVRLRARKEEQDAIASAIHVELAAVEQLMWGAYEDAQLSSVKLKDGSAVDVRPEPYASVKDAALLRAWVDTTPLAASLALPWATLNADVKARLLDASERLKAGITDPPGTIIVPPGVTVYVKTQTVLRKARG